MNDMNGWNDVKDKEPPVMEEVLGFDVFYDNYFVAYWDGKRRGDEGLPRLIPRHTGNDDVLILFWRKLPELPDWGG